MKPAILVLHGGGWVSGHPSGMQPVVDELKAAGYGAASIPYSLKSMHRAISDIRVYVRALKREGYPVVIWGASAGGHLALCFAATGEIDGAVSFMAPTNLLIWKGEWWLPASAIWKKLGLDRAERRHFSPVFRASRKAAPAMLFHGDKDTLVPFDHAHAYQRAVLAKVPRHDTLVTRMRGVGHELPPDRFVRAGIDWLDHRWA